MVYVSSASKCSKFKRAKAMQVYQKTGNATIIRSLFRRVLNYAARALKVAVPVKECRPYAEVNKIGGLRSLVVRQSSKLVPKLNPHTCANIEQVPNTQVLVNQGIAQALGSGVTIFRIALLIRDVDVPSIAYRRSVRSENTDVQFVFDPEVSVT